MSETITIERITKARARRSKVSDSNQDNKMLIPSGIYGFSCLISFYLLMRHVWLEVAVFLHDDGSIASLLEKMKRDTLI